MCFPPVPRESDIGYSRSILSTAFFLSFPLLRRLPTSVHQFAEYAVPPLRPAPPFLPFDMKGGREKPLTGGRRFVEGGAVAGEVGGEIQARGRGQDEGM